MLKDLTVISGLAVEMGKMVVRKMSVKYLTSKDIELVRGVTCPHCKYSFTLRLDERKPDKCPKCGKPLG